MVDVVVETGTGTDAAANSYVSIDEARAYAEQRGIVLAEDDDELGAQLVIANDYLQARECDYQGTKTSCDQPLAWPRKCVVLCCEAWPEDAIPKELKAAQITLVIAQESGVTLFPNVAPTDYVIEEQVGPVRTKFSDPASVGISTRMTGVEALLAPLYGSCEQTQFALRTMRV